MISEHHALITARACAWSLLDTDQEIMGKITHWARVADSMRDLRLEASPVGMVVGKVFDQFGSLTSLQHFAVRTLDGWRGYGWDLDRLSPWYARLANVGRATVLVDELADPGAVVLGGRPGFPEGQQWHDGVYPSAIDLGVHYTVRSATLRRFSGVHSLSAAAIGIAAHLIQDLCVPHHVTGTIGAGHKEWEDRMYEEDIADGRREVLDRKTRPFGAPQRLAKRLAIGQAAETDGERKAFVVRVRDWANALFEKTASETILDIKSSANPPIRFTEPAPSVESGFIEWVRDCDQRAIRLWPLNRATRATRMLLEEWETWAR